MGEGGRIRKMRRNAWMEKTQSVGVGSIWIAYCSVEVGLGQIRTRDVLFGSPLAELCSLGERL